MKAISPLSYSGCILQENITFKLRGCPVREPLNNLSQNQITCNSLLLVYFAEVKSQPAVKRTEKIQNLRLPRLQSFFLHSST